MFHVKRPTADRKREWTAESLYVYGLRFLTYRARSEREIRQRFQQRAAPQELVDGVIERLKAGGLVDDEAFARAWVDSRRRASPRGQRLLQRELAQKGVARDTAEAALDGVSDELSLAEAAAAKKARALASEPEAVFVRRLTDFLLRRGFDFDVTATCVRDLVAQRKIASESE
jgi:regulatory protein